MLKHLLCCKMLLFLSSFWGHKFLGFSRNKKNPKDSLEWWLLIEQICLGGFCALCFDWSFSWYSQSFMGCAEFYLRISVKSLLYPISAHQPGWWVPVTPQLSWSWAGLSRGPFNPICSVILLSGKGTFLLQSKQCHMCMVGGRLVNIA